MYEGLAEFASSGVFPPKWNTVIYVLLAKPRGDQRRVCKRRDIALLAQDLKLLCRMLKMESYDRMSGRIDPAQDGFCAGHSSVDPGLKAVLIAQMAKALGKPLYMLYIDLATFFPKCDRSVTYFAEAKHGLPQEVADLVALLFLEKTGQYDSAHGLGEGFDLKMGVLQGCVLSPSRAKLLLNTLVVAIRAHVRGFRLWQAKGRSVSQLVFCDDWLGCLESPDELVRAWELWDTWCLTSGCQLGIVGLEKTAVSAVRYVNGKAEDAPCPVLHTHDGVRVPHMTWKELYKHVGWLRRIDGDGTAARAKLAAVVKSLVARLVRAKHMRREEFVVASNAIITGVGNYYGAALWGSFDWADSVEASWRAAFRWRYGISRSSPRAWFYAATPSDPELAGQRRAHGEGLNRVHLHTVMSAALYSQMCRALGDPFDSDARAIARSAVALEAFRWGCRTPIQLWDCRHLESVLERQLAEKGKKTLWQERGCTCGRAAVRLTFSFCNPPAWMMRGTSRRGG